MAFDETKHPRDAHGRWEAGGAGADTSVDPRVLDVGGDKWNQDTATRLEHEYAAVRPELDKIANGAEESGASGRVPLSSQSWEDLPGNIQAEAEHSHDEGEYESYLQSEKDNWYQNGGALHDAKMEIATDEDFKKEWLTDYIANRIENDEPRIPYTAQQLSDAIEIDYEDDAHGEGKGDPTVEFDEKHLKEPDGFIPDSVQPSLPASSHLTEAMRDDMKASFIEAFQTEAESRTNNMSPPDYLEENAKEQVGSAWESMDDDTKLSWTKENTSLIEGEPDDTGPLKLPHNFDPLDAGGKFGDDYSRTQGIARYMADERAAQLITQRTEAGIIGRDAQRKIEDSISPAERYQIGKNSETAYGLWKNDGNPTTTTADLEKYTKEVEKAYTWKVALADPVNANLLSKVSLDLNPVGVAITLNTGEIAVIKDGAWVPKPTEAKTLTPEWTARMRESMQSADQTLWGGWKASSTGTEGRILQLATAEELGGRVRLESLGEKSIQSERKIRESVVADADKQFKAIGGFEGVKAAVRAKWETTQYLMDRANTPVVELFRGVSRPDIIGKAITGRIAGGLQNGEPVTFHPEMGNTGEWHHASGEVIPAHRVMKDRDVLNERSEQVFAQNGKMFTRLPDVAMVRNGAASATTDKGVANGWKQSTDRVVLRAEVPRTAVVSVPAYGINVHSEHEVVIAGTAWTKWDAWHQEAPSFETLPIYKPRYEFLGDDASYAKLYGKVAPSGIAAAHKAAFATWKQTEDGLHGGNYPAWLKKNHPELSA